MFPKRRIPRRFQRLSLWLLIGTMTAIGCGPKVTRFHIVDHQTDGATIQYFEEFDECYYCVEPDGHFDIVARRTGTGDYGTDEGIVQIVHLNGIWHSTPGRTYAEETMINATVSYMIVDGSGGASFEGGGFVSFRENFKHTLATGKLEQARLAPGRRLGDGRQIFERAEVRGEFKAVCDERRVKRIVTEMRHLFGPMPRHEPAPTVADVL